jgi:hypothetical protein
VDEKLAISAKPLGLNESTIRFFLKNGDEIRKIIEDGASINSKRVTRTRNVLLIKMEKTLMMWIEDCVRKKISICGILIK